MDDERPYKLKNWIRCLEDITKEFPSQNTSLDTAIKSFKSQLKELENK